MVRARVIRRLGAQEPLGPERMRIRIHVLTVMERLRDKGYVSRRKEDGVFRYAPCAEKAELLRGLVREFVETTLAGSVSPWVTIRRRS